MSILILIIIFAFYLSIILGRGSKAGGSSLNNLLSLGSCFDFPQLDTEEILFSLLFFISNFSFFAEIFLYKENFED